MNALSYISEQLAPVPIIQDSNKSKSPEDNNSNIDDNTSTPSNNIPTRQEIKNIATTDTATAHKDEGAADVSSSNSEHTTAIHDGTTKEINDDTTSLLFKVLKSKTVHVLWICLVFFPRYLVVKPLYFIWIVISLPLALVESGIRLKNRPLEKPVPKPQDDNSLKPIVEEDLVNGDEFIFQRDTIKGTFVKTSSRSHTSTPLRNTHSSQGRNEKQQLHDSLSDINSSSGNTIFGSKKMGKFLFPKKLIPKSIKYSGRKKILVIDLDETLIHSVSRGTTHVNSSQGHIIEVKFASSGVSTLYYVHKRPYCDLFLGRVSDWYDIAIFTASMKEYADPVIDWLESSFPGKFVRRLYRNDCTLRDGVGYIKDLSIFTKPRTDVKAPTQEIGLNEIIIIDNSPVSYAMNVDNAIQVEGWINDQTDTDLLNLIPFLESLRYTTDVRNILCLKNGEKSFGIA